jgi:hypothetical protein
LRGALINTVGRQMEITYWRNPETNLIEGIDQEGRITHVQKSLDTPFDATTKAGFTEHVRPDGSIYWVQEGLGLAVDKSWTYNPMIGGAVAGEIAMGGRLSTLYKTFLWCPPYAILARWLVKVPEFKAMIEQAVRDRALTHFEEIIETADETYKRMQNTDDELGAAKLKIDARKFLAEKGDQDKYGTKNKVQGDVAVQIVIDTGIVRDVTLTGIETKQITKE